MTSTVLITGCSSGLGRASARAFQAAGYLTVATARELSSIEDLAALGCKTLRLDVTDETSRVAAIRAVESQFGALGVLVNNAGYGQYGPLEEIPLCAYRKAFETNVLGGVRLAQLALEGMRRARTGRIINISSVAGRVATSGGGVYHMTKFALEAFADALRAEVQPFGIHVISILPGPFVSRYRETLLGTIPDTGPESPYVRYKRGLAGWVSRFLKPGGFGVMTAERVARVVLVASTAARPRARYPVGFWARWGPVGRMLVPDRLVDAWSQWRMPT